jgi:hypothetical protein
VFTDIEALVIIAAVLIVVYLVGTYWKHKTLTGYAHWFEDKLSSRGRVKFASHGHAGLRVKCEMKDAGAALKEVHFALSLGARENLIYYPYSLITHDSDKLVCWAVLQRPIKSNLNIVKQSDRKALNALANTPNLALVTTERLEEQGYVMYASDRKYAQEWVSKVSISERLKNAKDVESIQFDKLSSVLRLAAKLRPDSLPEMVSLMFVLGKSA